MRRDTSRSAYLGLAALAAGVVYLTTPSANAVPRRARRQALATSVLSPGLYGATGPISFGSGAASYPSAGVFASIDPATGAATASSALDGTMPLDDIAGMDFTSVSGQPWLVLIHRLSDGSRVLQSVTLADPHVGGICASMPAELDRVGDLTKPAADGNGYVVGGTTGSPDRLFRIGTTSTFSPCAALLGYVNTRIETETDASDGHTGGLALTGDGTALYYAASNSANSNESRDPLLWRWDLQGPADTNNVMAHVGNLTFAATPLFTGYEVSAMDFKPGTGTLYAAINGDNGKSYLATINTATAVISLIGETLDHISALAWLPADETKLAGRKYYDANANGQYDSGEAGIQGWPINVTGDATTSANTGSDGTFSIDVSDGTYTVAEGAAASAQWLQTGNLVKQSSATGVTLESDKSYTVEVDGAGVYGDLNFGNLCMGSGGATGGTNGIGYWTNKNGQNLITSDDLLALRNLHLRNADGSDFEPTTAVQVKNWLTKAKSTNMAYMLSAQLAAMTLNVRHGFVSGTALIQATGAPSANGAGFATVNAVMADAEAVLSADGNTPAGDPHRVTQEAIKNALEKANLNQTFVQATPATCPLPFPA